MVFFACGGSGDNSGSNPSDFNGTYMTSDDFNTCDSLILFYDRVEIENMSSAGFTWTDDDGEFSGRFISVDDEEDIIYTIEFGFPDIVCGATFSTSEDTDPPFDFMRIVCLSTDAGCEVLYGKPVE